MQPVSVSLSQPSARHHQGAQAQTVSEAAIGLQKEAIAETAGQIIIPLELNSVLALKHNQTQTQTKGQPTRMYTF